MKLILSIEAKLEIKATTQFINNEYGKKSAQKFKSNVSKTLRTIAQNPNVAKEEELLKNRKHKYRGMVIGHINKLIYYVEDNCVVVVDLWDCRRAPENLANRIKK